VHKYRVGFARSASLVLAALAAEGETWIDRVYHIDRGYERSKRSLRAVGPRLKESRVEADKNRLRKKFDAEFFLNALF